MSSVVLVGVALLVTANWELSEQNKQIFAVDELLNVTSICIEVSFKANENMLVSNFKYSCVTHIHKHNPCPQRMFQS